jgi:hypothetical protein
MARRSENSGPIPGVCNYIAAYEVERMFRDGKATEINMTSAV